MANKFYTATQVALSGLMPFSDRKTIARLIESGELKGMVRGSGRGKRYITTSEAIDEYLMSINSGKK